jgi:hypothetical protein
MLGYLSKPTNANKSKKASLSSGSHSFVTIVVVVRSSVVVKHLDRFQDPTKYGILPSEYF